MTAKGGDDGSGRRTRGAWLRAVASRAVVYAGAWALLADGEVGGWYVGGPTIALAVVASLILSPPENGRFRLRAAARFVAYFADASVRGAADVAIRAFRSPPDVAPGTCDLKLRLPEGPARIFLAAVVGLLPGTLGAARSDEALRIHLIDRGAFDEAELRRLEVLVAGLFGLDLDPDQPAPNIASTDGRGTAPT